MKNSEKKQKRYKTQPDKYSCGPYAIHNLLIWLGMKPKIKKIRKELECIPSRGTNPLEITEYLNDLAIRESLEIFGMRSPTLKSLDLMLKEEFAILIVFYSSESNGHFALITERTKHFYYIINGAVDKPTVSRYSRKLLKEVLKNVMDLGPEVHFPFAWAVRRVPE